MSDDLSVVDLCERLVQCDGLIEVLRAELSAVQVRIAELEAWLGMTSKNSSKPPSTDGLAKPAPKSLRRRSGRKPGGHPGHSGSRLEQVNTPDETIRHEPVACGGCGGDLGGAAQVGAQRRQVFDIPQIAVRVTEHQLIARRCGCGMVTAGQAPVGVSAPVQYGPRIAGIMVYLCFGRFLSEKCTAAVLAELLGAPASTGKYTLIIVHDRRSTEGDHGSATSTA